jgi:hypothetical protein
MIMICGILTEAWNSFFSADDGGVSSAQADTSRVRQLCFLMKSPYGIHSQNIIVYFDTFFFFNLVACIHFVSKVAERYCWDKYENNVFVYRRSERVWLKCIQQIHLCQSLAAMMFRLLLESLKGISCQVLIRFQQNWFGWEGGALCFEIHKFTKLIWNKEELPHQWKKSGVISIHKKVMKLTVIITESYHWCQLTTKCYPTFFCLTNSLCRWNYWESPVWILM